MPLLFSISGCSGTIFAYLSEFHDKTHRARAIMGASIIFAVCTAIAPLLAWGVINHDWRFYIPFIDVVYKPYVLNLIEFYFNDSSSFGLIRLQMALVHSGGQLIWISFIFNYIVSTRES